jgi:galactokinase
VWAERAREIHRSVFGAAPAGVAVSPGRVNLIGEHVDYNDGFVLPLAIDRGVAIAYSPRHDDTIRVHAAAFDETVTLDDGARGFSRAAPEWLSYVAAGMWAAQEAGTAISGADLTITTDLPMGAGLSSSAAVELAAARAVVESAAGAEWHPRRMAALARDGEHRFAGVDCGVMDQLAAACGVEGSALLIDCRSLEIRPVPLPVDLAVVVMDTGVRRTLSASEYNGRRAACERAVAAVQRIAPAVRALRDADAGLLARARDGMDEEAFRCASHVVGEIPRAPALVEALTSHDLEGAARLLRASHGSLRDLYRVSSPELDAMVDAADADRACVGARLTGAGFGGCAIALVDANKVDAFIADTSKTYATATGREGHLFRVRPSRGAHVV